MQVVLLERIHKLGQMGEVVKVKAGFARNFLLPRKKALRATKANMERFEKERAQLEARNLTLKKEAEGVAAKLDGQTYVMLRQAGEAGQLYGSVSARDISDAVTQGGVTIQRGQVATDKPIKDLGLHPVRIELHADVIVTVTINVARTPDEAERQARGENVLTAKTEEEEALEAAEALFESEEAARSALGKDDADEQAPDEQSKKKK